MYIIWIPNCFKVVDQVQEKQMMKSMLLELENCLQRIHQFQHNILYLEKVKRLHDKFCQPLIVDLKHSLLFIDLNLKLL